MQDKNIFGQKLWPWEAYHLAGCDTLEPDIMFIPYCVCYASQNTYAYGEPTDSIDLIIPYHTGEMNRQFLKRHKRMEKNDRTVVSFDFNFNFTHKWFLKGNTLYTGYVLDSSGNVRLRTIQEDLERVPSSFAKYFNGLDNTRYIPEAERQKIVNIIDDEIPFGDPCEEILPSKQSEYVPQNFYADRYGYVPSWKKAYRMRGKNKRYYGYIRHFFVPTTRDL